MARAVEIPKKEMYTYDDYAKLPEGAPYQLIGGKLIMTPAPSIHDQDIAKKLLVRLFSLEEKGLGKVFHAPINVYFEETETYQPDIIFISKERLGIIEEESIKGAPDLVIEILPPPLPTMTSGRNLRCTKGMVSGSTGWSTPKRKA